MKQEQPKPSPGWVIKRTATKLKDGLLEGWYFGKDDENSQNRVYHLTHNYTANIVANLVGGNFYTGLMLLLGAGDGFIGMMSMFTFGANLLQCLAPLLLERFTKRKGLLIGVRATLLFINVAFIGFIPFIPAGQQVQLTLFGIGVLLVQLLNASVAPGYNIWHIQFLPQNIRVKYFSLLSMTNGIVVALFNLIGSRVVDVFKAGGNELMGLTILRVFALVLVAVDMYVLFKMKEYPYEQEAEKLSIRKLLITPFKEKRYLRTIGIAFVWSLAANMPGSYYNVYLLKNLEVSYFFLNIVSFLNVPILLLLTPVWSRVLRKMSWLKMLNIAIALYAPHYIIYGFVTAENVLFLYPITLVYAFILAVGINLCFTNVPYINMPPKNQTIFIGFYSTMSNLGALIGSFIGRQIVMSLGDTCITLFGMEFVDKQIMIIIVGLFMGLTALSIFFLRRGVDEQK